MPKFFAMAGFALLAALVLGSSPAYAHAALVSADPGYGAHLARVPSRVSLTFNENVATPAYVAVTAPDGSPIKIGKIVILNHTVSATLGASDMKGKYSLSYRVVSADSHPVEGTTTFTVTTGRTVKQVTSNEKSFTHRHKAHLFWGLAGAIIALTLLLWPLRKSRS
ncbi:MAG: copper resistance protein CopC [Aeromicrobium sp.]